jgi:uncharacterized RDD family membrane protein YckC
LREAVDKVPAGLLRRLAALTYDSVLLAGPIALYAGIVVVLRSGTAVEPNTLWFSAGLVAIPALFFCWFWTHGGQTLGMVAWRLHLEAPDGGPPNWRRALLRFLAALLSLLPAGLGFIWALWDPERATWHDRISGTRMFRRVRAKRR